MKVTWIGRGGLYLQMGGQKTIIDPYLTDSVAAIRAFCALSRNAVRLTASIPMPIGSWRPEKRKRSS